MKTYSITRALPRLLLLVAVFLWGYYLGYGGSISFFSGSLQNAAFSPHTIVSREGSWGLHFEDPGAPPTGNATVEELAKYNAYYRNANDEPVLYLTFDCGYENGNTQAILDALEKHQAKATFFVVGHFLESAPELVREMVAQGHTIGNHTYHHYDMSKAENRQKFQEELLSVEKTFEVLFPQSSEASSEASSAPAMAKYYRPPQGNYNEENLKQAMDLGYATFFWSLAYKDWDAENQPDPQKSIQKLCDRVHPGAIVLLHNTSKTNGEILDALLTKWEAMGYSFGSLKDFTS